MNGAPAAHSPLPARAGPNYGALGLPLAFVALPLYVVLPHHYAEHHGVPLATLGALLLGVRLFDALVDPWIGGRVDRWFDRPRPVLLARASAAAAVLALGFYGLFFPWPREGGALLAWCGALLVLTYLGYSVLSVLHQAWGARLGGDATARARIVSWREGAALAGVLAASLLPSLAGLGATTAAFAVLLALGVALLARAPLASAAQAAGEPRAGGGDGPGTASPWRLPLSVPAFRRLLAVYLVNGIAAAVPATLVLFFVRDRLQAPALEPLFLAAYFAAAALSLPLWVRVIARRGLVAAWLAGMVLAVVAFGWTAMLGAGDAPAFALVCAASGAALGADLAVPGALLAGVIHRAGHGRRREGLYFGWWNFATKLNLALAAGLSLPLLGAAGYAPGSRDDEALQALTLAYAVLPCVLKTAAALLLWGLLRRPESPAP